MSTSWTTLLALLALLGCAGERNRAAEVSRGSPPAADTGTAVRDSVRTVGDSTMARDTAMPPKR